MRMIIQSKISISHALLLIMVLAMSGCMKVQKKIRISEPYKEADLLEYSHGKSTISGQGFKTQRNGGVVTCAGQKVTMYPGTPFLLQILKVHFSGDKVLYNNQEQKDGINKTLTYLKETQCDAQGNFIFKDIALGSWVIETTVSWYAGESRQGGTIRKMIEVTGDQKIILN